MFNQAKPARDAFTFSLGGMKTISSFFAAPAIADDQLNKAREARLRGVKCERTLARHRSPRSLFARLPTSLRRRVSYFA
ncbi:MAG: hypothetical protein ACR2QV_04100 [Gammaproteobacteria bacterium]